LFGADQRWIQDLSGVLPVGFGPFADDFEQRVGNCLVRLGFGRKLGLYEIQCQWAILMTRAGFILSPLRYRL
jgi:hypothetical protein